MSQDQQPSSHFVSMEKAILEFWKTHAVFEKTLEQNKDNASFIFYDGPPFATGLPHHGHLLASTIKDIIPRYQTMNGYHVPRRFGWDCHGLPIEHEINKQFGQSTGEIVSEHGLAHYNNACRQIIMRYRDDWYQTIHRIGRWVDFENDYKTMDASFMESVWWVFGELWDKGLVYQGNKVVAYSTALQTPLSNFEASSNYQTVQDPAITVAFSLKNDPVDLLVWTTTPWTLPANMGICLNGKLKYIQIRVPNRERSLIIAESRVDAVFSEYIVEKAIDPQLLSGQPYIPLFPNPNMPTCERLHTLFLDPFVTEQDGTGLVHMAPAFGEDDQRVMQEANIHELFCPINDHGQYTHEVADFLENRNVFDCNSDIIRHLKHQGALIDQKTIDHAYPHCPRSDTKLIYRAVPSWYLDVKSIKDKLLTQLEKTHWMPAHVKEKRFTHWLENARDWAISRNRYWGNPIPLWVNDITQNIVCINSIEKLESLSGQKVTDLHREHVDHITFSLEGEQGVYRRTPEVLDCWFESGAMPFAQSHYPFSEKKLDAIFPADFIAEGLDQTRGWFYTLHVIASALFDSPAYKHVNVNGIILATDGKKMSKRLKNYTRPDALMEEHGADPLRLYLIHSNLLKAEEMRFCDQGIREMSRKVLMPWFNAFSFLKTYATLDQWQNPSTHPHSEHVLDQWIVSRLQSLKLTIENAMTNYALYLVVPDLVHFIDELTNTYIRLNRARFWQSGLNQDKKNAYQTLFHVCLEFSQIMAPFCPFMSEHIYQDLQNLQANGGPLSVHLCTYPKANQELINPELEQSVALMNDILILTRQKRNDSGIKIKTPLSSLKIIHHDNTVLHTLTHLEAILAKELNVKQINYDSHDTQYIQYSAAPDAKTLGKIYGKAFKNINTGIRTLSHSDIAHLIQSKSINIEGHLISLDHIFVRCKALNPEQVSSNQHIAIELNTALTPELQQEGHARELVSAIQKARKESGFLVEDRINLTLNLNESLKEMVHQHQHYIQAETLCTHMAFQSNANDFLLNTSSGDIHFCIKKIAEKGEVS
ncbi:isoleucine--tRNA ligase [Gammaproteobacteria bacterium]|nr:isoleucine--tRNA ligase [Gammaproteobacteria bacterium]